MMLQIHYLATLMKGRSIIFRFATFLLLLIFSQKVGAGLFLHDLLHTANANSKNPLQEKENGKDIAYACNCIDDFLTPFIETDEPVVFADVLLHVTPVNFFKEDIFFTSRIFSSLRGPPSLML